MIKLKLLQKLFKLFFIIILFIPVILLISIIFLIHKLFLQGDFFFIQERAGFNQKIFKLIKIKTMNDNKVTLFGFFLRKTKLDEIPQFFSVISGDLNFIGPRPLLIKYKNFYKDSEKVRFLIKPGITGLSQIKSTSKTNWDIRLRWDVIYIKKKSFKLDFYIVLSTCKLIVYNFFNRSNNLDNFIRLDEVRRNN